MAEGGAGLYVCAPEAVEDAQAMMDFEDPLEAISRDIADLRGEMLSANVIASLALAQLVMLSPDRSAMFEALAERLRSAVGNANFEGGDPEMIERAKQTAMRRTEMFLAQLKPATQKPGGRA